MQDLGKQEEAIVKLKLGELAQQVCHQQLRVGRLHVAESVDALAQHLEELLSLRFILLLNNVVKQATPGSVNLLLLYSVEKVLPTV